MSIAPSIFTVTLRSFICNVFLLEPTEETKKALSTDTLYLILGQLHFMRSKNFQSSIIIIIIIIIIKRAVNLRFR